MKAPDPLVYVQKELLLEKWKKVKLKITVKVFKQK